MPWRPKVKLGQLLASYENLKYLLIEKWHKNPRLISKLCRQFANEIIISHLNMEGMLIFQGGGYTHDSLWKMLIFLIR